MSERKEPNPSHGKGGGDGKAKKKESILDLSKESFVTFIVFQI